VIAGLVVALVVAICPATIEFTGILMTEPLRWSGRSPPGG
jgi:hypothetical protein